MSGSPPIGSMPLYTHLDRIERGLAALGIGPADPVRPEQLFPLDQWHYGGTDAVRSAVEHLGLRSSNSVLDVGSGLGGPARFLAYTAGCHVTALELQPELPRSAAASRLAAVYPAASLISVATRLLIPSQMVYSTRWSPG